MHVVGSTLGGRNKINMKMIRGQMQELVFCCICPLFLLFNLSFMDIMFLSC